MARTTITPASAPGQFPTAGAAAVFTAADVGNMNQALASGKDLIIVRNTNATSPEQSHTFTLSSVADEKNRYGNITDTIPAGATRVYGPLPWLGWKQTDGYLYFNANDAEVVIAVVALP